MSAAGWVACSLLILGAVLVECVCITRRGRHSA